MSKSTRRREPRPTGFQPIEVEIGPQNPPAVSEVDFTPQPAAPAKPQPAAPKED